MPFVVMVINQWLSYCYWLWWLSWRHPIGCDVGWVTWIDLILRLFIKSFLETSTFWDAVFRTSQKIGSNFINCRSRNWDNMILTDCWTWQRKNIFSRYWLRALKAPYFQIGWKANSTCLGDWSSPHSGGATTSTLIRSGGLRRWGSRNLQQKKT